MDLELRKPIRQAKIHQEKKLERRKFLGAKTSRASTASTGEVGTNKKAKKGWNDMSHLSIKRFAGDDPSLTAGAKRDRASRPYVACAEMDPSGRATCKLCGERISKGEIRLSLMLECHKGYRNLCTLHQDCFWRHSETKKLTSADEIFMHKSVVAKDSDAIKKRFDKIKNEDTPKE